MKFSKPAASEASLYSFSLFVISTFEGIFGESMGSRLLALGSRGVSVVAIFLTVALPLARISSASLLSTKKWDFLCCPSWILTFVSGRFAIKTRNYDFFCPFEVTNSFFLVLVLAKSLSYPARQNNFASLSLLNHVSVSAMIEGFLSAIKISKLPTFVDTDLIILMKNVNPFIVLFFELVFSDLPIIQCVSIASSELLGLLILVVWNKQLRRC